MGNTLNWPWVCGCWSGVEVSETLGATVSYSTAGVEGVDTLEAKAHSKPAVWQLTHRGRRSSHCHGCLNQSN